MTIAYLANTFPAAVEPYVEQEILELRRRGIRVIAGTVKKGETSADPHFAESAGMCLSPVRFGLMVRGLWLCLRHRKLLADQFERISSGPEPWGLRMRALAHTWLGACYALRLRERAVEHIHVHHGYSAAWIAMVAARLLDISYSMTLHGSDLLVDRIYLDIKLRHCRFCFTVSEFNRNYLLRNFPEVPPEKIAVQRMGVDVPAQTDGFLKAAGNRACLLMLAVGRLHRVKNYDFLLDACALLRERGLEFQCLIAGDGPERAELEWRIGGLGLQRHVQLLGHLSRPRLDDCYRICDVVVLTSRSEGIPLVLMEAMAHGKAVLAPNITGIPELVKDGANGFLYPPGSLEGFVERVEFIYQSQSALGPLRRAARRYVLEQFNRKRNLDAFCEAFLSRLHPLPGKAPDANPVLQQV